MNALTTLALVTLSLATAAGLRADPFIDAVVSFTPGDNAGHGQSFLPGNITGPPEGNEDTQTPQMSEEELLSLGHGGSITLEFTDNIAHNGDGDDFIIFENVLVAISTDDPFIEVATIEVSQDGIDWFEFPYDMVPPADPPVPTAPKAITAESFIGGFAGINPTLSNSTNGIDPTDPAVAGGDAFDLDVVGLPWIRFIRLTDSGLIGSASQRMDGDGDILEDDGDFALISGGTTAGFDLDAIAAIHSEGTSPVAGWSVYR